MLAVNRGHWAVESVHYLLDWNYDEDRSRISAGFGPENVSRLRRFAIGVLKSFQKPGQSIAAMMRKLCLPTRLVFDYLRMTENSQRPPRASAAENKFAVAACGAAVPETCLQRTCGVSVATAKADVLH